MKALITGIKTFVSFFETLFSMIMSIFETIGMVFTYLITIVQVAFTFIATLPAFLKAFAIVTIALSIGYIIIGRNVGKSD